MIAIESVDKNKADRYGIVNVDDKFSKTSRIEKIVEKSKPEVAPSNLGVVGC